MKRIFAYSTGLIFMAAACDFGASNYKVVSGDGDGGGSGDGDGDVTGGDGDGDTSGGDGDTSSGDGDGSGGMGSSGDGDGDTSSGDGDGTGGSDSGPTGSCLAQPEILIFSSADTAGYDWGDFRGAHATVVDGSALAVVIELESGAGSGFFYRMINDQSNWNVEDMVSSSPFSDPVIEPTSLSGVSFRPGLSDGDGELVFVARTLTGMGEFSIPILGKSVVDSSAVHKNVPVPPDCTTNAHIRSISPGFTPDGAVYAITCQNETDQLRPFAQVGMPPVFEALSDWSSDVANQILRFIPLGDGISPPAYFFQMGGDFGDAGYRYAAVPADEIPSSSTPISFDDDRISAVFSARVADGSGVFMVGAAVTATDPESPEFVPADFYAGSITNEELDGFAAEVPPSQLNHYGMLSNVTKLFKLSPPVQLGQFFYSVGDNFASAASIGLTLFDRDGNALVRDFIVAEDDSGATLYSAAVTGMGGVALVTYAKEEGGVTQLFGKKVICGVD